MSKVKSQKSKAGFTLLELIVVISIISVVLTVLLGSRNTYLEKLNIKTQAYDLVLYLRQAQLYSLGVRGFTKAGSPTDFSASYGVSIYGGGQEVIKYFVDENHNGIFNPNEFYNTLLFSQGIAIYHICGTQPNGTEDCNNNAGYPRVDITFNRPTPMATIKFIDTNGVVINYTYPAVRIYIRDYLNPGTTFYTIKVDNTGQISIK